MSSKLCEICGMSPKEPLYSMNKYWCEYCKTFHPFNLKPGQKSILIKGLVGEGKKKST